MIMRIIGLLGLTVLLSGCGVFNGNQAWLRDRAKDYHRAEVTASLEVPDNFHIQPHVEDYPVPKGYDSNNKNYQVSILPPSEPTLQTAK